MKILINNEEVLCDKNIKITEEMLNTSSTILNNVYPKSWETNHNYTNYYYPKDYSQCLIWSDKLRDVSFKGFSSQDGTPTPSNPVSIKSMTSNTNIEIPIGKNIFDYSSFPFARKVAYSNGNLVSWSGYSGTEFYVPVEEETTYTFSNDLNAPIHYGIVFYNENKTIISYINAYTRTFTTPTNCKYIRLSIEANPPSWVQIEKGSEATQYEAFKKENNYIDLEDIELCSINNYNLFNKDDVVLGKRLDQQGRPFNDSGYYYSSFIKVNPNTNYIKSSPTADAYHRVCFYSSDNETSFISKSEANVFTTPNNCNYIRVCGNEHELNATQVELGNVLHSYAPYGVPIPVIYDKIYNVGDNWYIEKNIKKVVLDGSETGWVGNSPATGIMRYYRNFDDIYTFTDQVRHINTTMSDRFIPVATNYVGGMFHYQGQVFFMVNSDDIANVNEWKNWLSNNKLVLYYQLATPIIEQITDENIINSLNVLIKDLLFSGVAKRTGNISLNPYHAHYCDLQILDYKALLSEGDMLDFVIADKTVEQAIDMVIDAIKDYGFIKGNIEIPDNFKMGTYNTQEKTAYDVFQYISDITQTKWTTRVINQDTVAIDFFNPYDKAPVGTIDSTKEYFKENNIVDISYNYSTEDYRNKQVLTSNEVVSSITQTFRVRMDGVNKTYDLGLAIGDISYAYYVTSTDFVICDIITKAQQEQGYSGDIIYTPGESTFETDDLLAEGVMLDLDVNLLVPGRQIAMNDSEIQRIGNQNNRKGVISRYENRDDTTSSVELQRIAQSYIEYKGKAEIELTVKTQNKKLCDVGDVLIYNSSIEDLSDNYMCKSIETEMIMTTGDIFYTFIFTNTYNTENAINYFDNQRNKTLGNISDGETITRNLDIENSLDIVFFDSEVI